MINGKKVNITENMEALYFMSWYDRELNFSLSKKAKEIQK